MSKISKIFGGGKDKSAERAAEEARQREAQRQARLATGRGSIESAFSSFDDPYYDSRAKAYTEFAMPDLETQFGDQKKKLVYALSRGGKLNSTSAGESNRKLQDEYDKAQKLILSRGQQYGTDARREVANSRAQLLSMLSSTEDPTTVANEALRQATTLREQPAFEPLGNLFSDIAGNLEKSVSAGRMGQAFNSGVRLNQGGGSSGRVVRG